MSHTAILGTSNEPGNEEAREESTSTSGKTAQDLLNGVPNNPGHEELLQMHWLTLCFQSPGMEAEYMADVARQRRPVLMCVFIFDIAIYLFRLSFYGVNSAHQTFQSRLSTIMPQLMNMIALHSIVGWVNWRSRRLGSGSPRESTGKHQGRSSESGRGILVVTHQEEFLLGMATSLAICTLIVSLTPLTAQDYVFATMFLICTSSFLKIRWLWGTAVLSLPLFAAHFGGKVQQIPADAIIHLFVAWAVGGLMSFLADSYRRQMFANQQLAREAAEKEIQEAKARTVAQRALADAQSQAAARALTVAKEKAANEAKSEFMSLMCHEVRTPLNGCLASAEMLLETKLEVEQRELAKTIRVSGSILLSTVSNFLDFFKTEAGKQLDVVCTDVEVQELVNDVYCIIEAMIARSSDVTLLKPQLVNIPQYLLGDSDRLRGILLNLYTNAAKFTRRGAISLRVSVEGPNYRPRASQHAALYKQDKQNTELKTQDKLPSPETSGSSNASMPPHDGQATPPRGKSPPSDRDGALDQPPADLKPDALITRRQSQANSTTSSLSGGADAMPEGGPFSQEAVQARALHDSIDSSRPESGGQSFSTSASSQQSSDVLEGWSQVVSSRTGVVSSSGSDSGDVEDAATKWVFFEVADTGIGIGPKGLKSLFKEFVQGTEDEMKRPRSRGGTGLGLSICSKQVGVLGGRVGALSKLNTGSIFWFCIPLRVPDPAAVATGIELRRTASWGSRDAFTDGHLSHHGDASHSKSGGKRSNTVRAHAFRKFHPAYKPHALMQAAVSSGQLQPLRTNGSDTPPHERRQSVGEHRRNSAPELADQWQRPEQAHLPVSLPKQVQRLTQPQLQSQQHLEAEPHPEEGSSAASFSEAKALLIGGGVSISRAISDDNALARDRARASHDLRASLNLERNRPSMDQIRESSLERPDSFSRGSDRSYSGTRPSLEEVKESALEMDKITANRSRIRDQQLDGQAVYQQNGSCENGGTMESNTGSPGSRSQQLAAAEAEVTVERNKKHANRTIKPEAVPEDAELSGKQLERLGRKSSDGMGRRINGRQQMRPSMEARWRKLDISALQGRRVLLAEDNLINQKVAQMMLTSLGMAVELANNGREAMESILKSNANGSQFHCVLMDMAMPVMGGVDATLAVRRAGVSVPIVAMTANASDRDRDECLSSGMDGFLSKPVLKDRLAEAILLAASGRGRYNADSLVALKPYEAL